VGTAAGPVRTENGMLGLVADASIDDVRSADVLVVPGGIGTRALLHEDAVTEWVRAVDATTTWTTSGCTGSPVVGGAGRLARARRRRPPPRRRARPIIMNRRRNTGCQPVL